MSKQQLEQEKARQKAVLDQMKKAANADPDLKEFKPKQRWLLFCLKAAKGLISIAARNAGVSRYSFHQFMLEKINGQPNEVYDPKFAAMVKEIREQTHDWVESKLLQNIDSNDQKAIEYYLSNNARDRGYSSATQKVDVTSNGNEIQQTPLVFVSVDDLSEEELEAYKKKYLGEDDAGDNNQSS